MTNFNGANQHNVEQLLATIRSTIADETGSIRSQPRPVFATIPQRRDSVLAEEAAEFELPAIFKPGHQATPEKPNLLGRLSEALKTQPPAEPDRSRTVIRFEPAGGRMIEPPPAMVERQEPQPATAPIQDVSKKVAEENSSVKREMASFFDNRMNRLGEMSRSTVEAKQAQPSPMMVQPPPVYAPMPPQHPAAFAPAPFFAEPPQNLNGYGRPPALPEAPPVMMQSSNGGVEDVAAQMLRPILRQWLSDNMPKIVENALRSEAGGSMPQQQLPPPPPTRKTLR